MWVEPRRQVGVGGYDTTNRVVIGEMRGPGAQTPTMDVGMLLNPNAHVHTVIEG